MDREYSIKALLGQMIVYSDNVAFGLLAKSLDYRIIEKTYQNLGIDLSKEENQEVVLSVKDYATFFRILFNSSYLSEKMSETALKFMVKSPFKEGLAAGVPKEIEVSHKFGERFYKETGEKQLHDCGIVYYPGKPYLACIITKGTDFSDLSLIIKDLSALLYAFVSKK